MKKELKHIQLGRLRKIEFFDVNDSNKIDGDFSYLMESNKVKDVFKNENPVIIGLVDDNHCLLIDQSKQGHVFIDFNYLDEHKLIPIADSLAKLDEILFEINKIWEGKENSYSLKKDPETIDRYKKIMKWIESENPNSNPFFWRYYAFRELEIDLA
jgi:hypothetical protein